MTLTKKISAVMAAFVVVFALGMAAGCSNSSQEAEQPSAEEPWTVDVLESGATVKLDPEVAADGTTQNVPEAHFAFTVSNPHDGFYAQNVGFDVMGYDDNDVAVFSGSAEAAYVYPGITNAITGHAMIDVPEGIEVKVSSVKVTPNMVNVQWVDTGLSNEQISNMFAIENESTNVDGGIFTLSATATGDLADANKVPKIGNVEGVLEGHCVVLLYDEDGKILMGSEDSSVLVDQQVIDKADEKRKNEDMAAPINLSASISNPPAYKEYKLFVMPGL